MPETRTFVHHAPWLLAIGGLVLALTFARADLDREQPAQPPVFELSTAADGGVAVRGPHVLVNGIATIDVVPDVVDVTIVVSVEMNSPAAAVASVRGA